jgi:hypothetical protein
MTNWEGFGRKRSWSNFDVLSWHYVGGTEKDHEKVSPDRRSPDRDLNLGPLQSVMEKDCVFFDVETKFLNTFLVELRSSKP